MNEFILSYLLFDTASSPRPQLEVGDRRQIDDMEVDDVRSKRTTNWTTVSSDANAGVATDELGPLSPGWQMLRTDNDCVFFIDHINKRTTWIKEEKIIQIFLLLERLL